MVAVVKLDGTVMEPRHEALELRITELRSLSDAEERADLARALAGIRVRMDRVSAAKSAFDRAIAHRLDKESRQWTSLAQTAYAAALDDAEAALNGHLFGLERPLPPAPAFRALAGTGIITLHPGRDGIHRVEYRLAPNLDPVATMTIEHGADRRCRLRTDASQLPPGAVPTIERAVDALLADPWRTALCILLDRCVETSMFASCVVAARLAALGGDVESPKQALPLLRRSI